MTDNNKKLGARILDKQEGYKGFLKINKYTIEKDLHEGGTLKIEGVEVMERGHAVGVLAYDVEADKVLLISEMRPGILVAGEYPYSDSLPAGGMAKGESAIEAARREIIEETGVPLENAQVIHEKAFVSPGGTSEYISIVFGTVASKKAGGVHGLKEEHEDIKTHVVSSDEFMKKIDSGEINDMKTMVACYWLDKNKQQLRAKYGTPKP